MDARREAQARLDLLDPGRYSARVLEPSPPAVTEPPWFADDPVAVGPGHATVVSPVSSGDVTWDELAAGDADLAGWCADRGLGAWRPLRPVGDRAVFAATRDAWHRVAEHVLAPARAAATGKIGLRFTRGGLGTPFLPGPGPGRQLRVAGTVLMVDDGQERAVPLRTLGEVAGAVGVTLGAGTGLYRPATPAAPAMTLEVDLDAAARLGDWYALGAAALEQLRADAPDGAGVRPQLWPEHLDLSVDVGDEARGARGTFGVSPGDAEHPLPYLYVTHWADVAPDPFWNDSAFAGASLGYEALVGDPSPRAAALTFFAEGRARLAGA